MLWFAWKKKMEAQLALSKWDQGIYEKQQSIAPCPVQLSNVLRGIHVDE